MFFETDLSSAETQKPVTRSPNQVLPSSWRFRVHRAQGGFSVHARAGGQALSAEWFGGNVVSRCKTVP
jgi:hypothetical protein